MKIIISGCGKIGMTILQSLVEEGHDITALDIDDAVIDEITNIYDVMGVCGNCTDCETLKEARIDTADLFVAVTGSDEINMLACFLSKRMGAKHTIARIRNPEYNYSSLVFLRQQLDLSMAINPELLAAQEIYNILKFPSAVKIESFSRRDFEMIEIRLKQDSLLDGMNLITMREKYKAKVLVCAVQRDDEVFIPNGNFVLKGGDKLGITATQAEFVKFFKALNVYQREAKDVMILGGSRTAYYLAKMLANGGNDVKIIDRDPEICQRFSEDIPKATVIVGDGAHQELLIEEGIKETEAFVSLTGIDEENILMSVFASSLDVPKVISKVNRDELYDLAENLGLDTVISPKKIISDVLVRYVRALNNSFDSSNIETLYHLMDETTEAIEFRVSAEFEHLNIPIKDLGLKDNIIIAGIIRERKPIIPIGDDVIMANDRVIVIAAGRRLQELSEIIKKG
ncbi:MAG: Trk system potassium transporter TrkA [Ruminococcaceae bacterium]|nr:Trk system potassium transporter TrkA [Oscillospiraceae bacterium]